MGALTGVISLISLIKPSEFSETSHGNISFISLMKPMKTNEMDDEAEPYKNLPFRL